MDCCNYMQHRQSYYGSQYYESGHAYHHDFQHHQYNSDTQHYGPPNWGFAASCSDYVYNPKEARIRKALRDRERSIANTATVRSRRSNWSRQSPAPQMPPIVHTDPRMNIPNKDFRSVIRHELEHGFLANTSNYMYPSQPYLFPPQSEYMSYINAIPSSNWTPNTYNMQSNNVVQQQIWNQYQNDRVRAQQSQGTSYVLNHEGPPPEYQIEHMPTNNVQMGPAPKSNIHQNLENAASDVDRYLNIPNIINTPSRSNPVQTANSVPVSVTNNLVCNNTDENVSNIISSTAISNVTNESTPVSNIDTSCTHENSANSDISINNVTNMSDVGTPLNMENSRDADSNFEGIQLYNEDSVSSMTGQDIRKNLNNPNQLIGSRNEIKSKNSLPDFNQAFGSTERGRFQSPPDPRLGPDKEYLEFFHDNFTVKVEQYNKWAETAQTYTPPNFNISY